MPVLIILAVLWAVVLVPPILRSRSQRTADSIVDFNYKLDVLGQTGGNRRRRAASPVPGAPDLHVTPMGANAAQRSARRRGQVLSVLAFSIVTTLLLAVASHLAAAWAVQVLVDLAAVAYIALWAWLRTVQAERLDKVRYIPDLRVPEIRHPAMALRRSASS